MHILPKYRWSVSSKGPEKKNKKKTKHTGQSLLYSSFYLSILVELVTLKYDHKDLYIILRGNGKKKDSFINTKIALKFLKVLSHYVKTQPGSEPEKHVTYYIEDVTSGCNKFSPILFLFLLVLRMDSRFVWNKQSILWS